MTSDLLSSVGLEGSSATETQSSLRKCLFLTLQLSQLPLIEEELLHLEYGRTSNAPGNTFVSPYPRRRQMHWGKESTARLLLQAYMKKRSMMGLELA